MGKKHPQELAQEFSPCSKKNFLSQEKKILRKKKWLCFHIKETFFWPQKSFLWV